MADLVATLAVAAEREACARIALTLHEGPDWDHFHQIAERYGAAVAAAIRAQPAILDREGAAESATHTRYGNGDVFAAIREAGGLDDALEHIEDVATDDDGWLDPACAPIGEPVLIFWRVKSYLVSAYGQAVADRTRRGGWHGGPSRMVGFAVEAWKPLGPPPKGSDHG